MHAQERNLTIIPLKQRYQSLKINEHCIKRSSCDKMINKFGSDLIELCKTYSLRILSGRTGSDKQIGEYTFIGPNGNNVIDYGICSVDLFEIGTRTESCHSPIIIDG